MEIKISEASVKRAVEDYLTILEKQGKLVYFRLNAGTFIMEGRFIKGTKKGTADLVVIQPFKIPARIESLELNVIATNVIFIECKSSTGKQSSAQKAFQEQVEKLGAEYIIARDVRDVQEVIDILGGE